MTDITTHGTVNYDAIDALNLAAVAKRMVASSQDFIIDSPDMAAIAADDLKQVKRLQKDVEDRRVAVTGPLNAALKSVNDLFRAPKEYLARAESLLKGSILSYTTEQERLAEQARRAAEEQARIERAKIEAEARVQAERARRAAEEAEAAEEAKQQALRDGDTEAACRAASLAQAKMAEVDEASALAQEGELLSAVITVTPAVEAPAKIAGLSGRVTWHAQVDSLLTLARAVAEGKAPIEAIVANDKFLSAQAKAFKKAGELYPGVRAVSERGLAARSS